MSAEPRYFHVVYTWCAEDGAHGVGDACMCSLDGRPVSRSVIAAWRECLVQKMADQDLVVHTVSITGWQEYESSEGWDR